MVLREQIEKVDGTKFPGQSFKRSILKPIFDIQKEHYFHPFMDITKAHVIMLAEQKIITRKEGCSILKALINLENQDFRLQEYDDSFEDMFFMIEKKLEDMIGKDVAGKIHIARSRNDIDLCEFRMVLRKMVLEVLKAIDEFREVLLLLVKENIHTIMPAYTHTQPAQPTTLAHYFLSFYDGLKRDYDRFLKALENLNKSPLGAVAITTTGFQIRRERTSELLGFDGLVENSYDCIAGVDYLTEVASVLMIFNVNMSKFMKDTLDFCTKEFNVYYLSDPYVQTSSIMPQKRNPSSLEHCRPLAGKAIGEAKTVFDVLYNTPYGDIVDAEEQLQPHVYDAIKYTLRILEVVKNVFATLKVNKEVLLNRSKQNFITVTELADTLVREKGLSFRESHHLTSQIIKYLINENLQADDIEPDTIKEISQRVLGYAVDLDQQALSKALDLQNFISIREIIGGPAPKETERMLKGRLVTMEDDMKKIKTWESKFLDAHNKIYDAIRSLDI